jgi:hypothetical protein
MRSRLFRARSIRSFSERISFVLLSALLCFILLCPTQAFTQQQNQLKIINVDAEGAGVVISGDMARARDSAIKDSLVRAVEQAVRTFLSQETVAENFQVINDNIYSKSRDYIQNYKITEEIKGADYYRVRIRAAVSDESIRNDLASMGFPVASEEMPRVMIVIYEHNEGQEQSVHSWQPEEYSTFEYILRRNFSEEGFVLVDYPHEEYRTEILNDQDAVLLGGRFNADLVIIGEAVTGDDDEVVGTEIELSVRSISAKAIRTDDNAVVASAASIVEAYNAPDITDSSHAVEKAADKVAESLKVQIIAVWQQEISSVAVVTVTIRDIRNFSHYVVLRDVLKTQTRGVKNVYQRRMESGVAVLDVEVQGNARMLANELSAKSFDDFSLGIISTFQDSLELNILE